MNTTETQTVKDGRGITYEVIYSRETSEAMRQGGCVWSHFIKQEDALAYISDEFRATCEHKQVAITYWDVMDISKSRGWCSKCGADVSGDGLS